MQSITENAVVSDAKTKEQLYGRVFFDYFSKMDPSVLDPNLRLVNLQTGETRCSICGAEHYQQPCRADGRNAEPASPNARKNQIARINRQLAKQGEKLRTSSERERHNLGDYHIINIQGNHVICLNVDPDALEADLRSVA